MNLREGVEFIVVSKSRMFLFSCGFFILGIFFSLLLISSRQPFLQITYFGFLVCLFLLVWFWNKSQKRNLVFLFIIFIFGVLRGILSIPNYNANHVINLVGKKTEIVGVVVSTQNGISGRTYEMKLDNYVGNVLISTPLYPRYNYGDRLQVFCQFDFPDVAGYARYLKTRNIFATCGFGKIEKIGEGGGNFLGRVLASWRLGLEEKISLLWPEPRASLLAGILYGERGSMPPELKTNFSNSGLSHIVAVSGYNTSVVALLMMVIFIFIGLWRRQAFLSSGISLILFTLFTGASASVVRAAVMAIFVMAGNYLGRPARMINSLVLAAALMLLANPSVLLDVGFQLSFLATVGVAYVGPIFSKNFIIKIPEFISELFFTTLGALAITLPLTIFYFGRIPLLAIVANILVVGFIPVLMLLGFVALLISFVSFYLALPVAFAADVGLRYIIWVSEKLSVGSVDFQLPLIIVILIYSLLIFWLSRLNPYVSKSKN